MVLLLANEKEGEILAISKALWRERFVIMPPYQRQKAHLKVIRESHFGQDSRLAFGWMFPYDTKFANRASLSLNDETVVRDKTLLWLW